MSQPMSQPWSQPMSQPTSQPWSQEPWLIDTPPSPRYPVYTRFNANDVLPDPISPLGASLAWNPHVLRGWAAGYVALGAFTAEELGDLTAVAGFFHGHLYVNQTVVRRMGIRMGLGWQAIDAAFFSSDAPPHDPQADDTNETLSARLAERTAWTLSTTTFPEVEEERVLADAVRASRPDLSAMSGPGLVAWARAMMPLERLMWRSETIGGSQAATGPAVLGQLVGVKDPSLVLRLIGRAGDVDSAAPSYALWELSRAVRADAALTAALDGGGVDDLDGILGRHPDFAARFRAFLRDFGYRGPSEWDLGADSWETRPELALGLVDRLRLLGDEAAPASREGDQEADTAAALGEAQALLGDDETAQATLTAAVASARRFGAWRERGKTNAIKVLHEARVALFELGRRLAVQGHLDRPQQLFMALDDELDLLTSDPARLTAVLQQREREWQQLFDVELPLYVDGREPLGRTADLPPRSRTADSVVAEGEVLQGAPGAAGVARGRARVVRDTGDITAFEPGEVLVAPQTDPSWTPLFMVAAAVVVDVGAMGSHAMIVSRELGIPCAAGVRQATLRIPDGALVEVDGATGTVTVVSLPA